MYIFAAERTDANEKAPMRRCVQKFQIRWLLFPPSHPDDKLRSSPDSHRPSVMSAATPNRSSSLPQYCSSVSLSLSLSLLPPSLFPPSPSIKFESRVKHVLHNFVIPSPPCRQTDLERQIQNFLQMERKDRCSLLAPFDIGRWRRKHDSPFSPLLSGVVGVVRFACGCYAV